MNDGGRKRKKRRKCGVEEGECEESGWIVHGSQLGR